MSQAGLLSLSTELSTFQIVILIISTFYVGIYMIISNHFVFKPKIEEYFSHNQIQSKALYQFVLDFLTNLSQLTFILCALLIDQSDSPLRIMTFSDMSWTTLCIAIISFKCIKNTQEKHWPLFLKKNTIILSLIYVIAWAFYFMNYFSMLMGIVFMAIYIINLIIDSNEEKFIQFMGILFGYQGNDIQLHAYEHKNNMVSPDILARRFPVKEKQIMDKMKVYSKQFKGLKIKTRINVTENLMKIALAVHISKEKMQAKQKRDVKYYFGAFNGTILEKSKRVILERKNTALTHRNSEEQDIQQAEIHQNQHFNSFLFYFFPVKIFESNRFISVLFSIILNFGFGFFLSVTISLTSSHPFSKYAQFLYAILLIPLTPTNIPKEQFYNSMSLSSLWKYCIYGIVLLISGILGKQVRTNNRIVYLLGSQVMSIIFISYTLLMKKTIKFKFIFLWIFLFAINQIMIFKYT